MGNAERTNVVILGAGFAGLNVARELARQLPNEQDATITLVDQNNFTLFTPMLTEVAGGQLDSSDVVSAVRLLAPRVTFEQGRIDGVDLSNRRVTLTSGGNQDGIPEAQRVLAADHLVVAVGSVTNFHGLHGVQEHALTIKSIGDAATIRNRAIELLEAADAEPDQEQRRALLTFVVGGGGFSGVETMAALNDLVRGVAGKYRHVDPADIRTVLVHPQKRLLPEISAGLANYAQMQLQQRGVEVILNTEIKGADSDWVELEGGKRIKTHLLVWTAGVTPSPIVKVLDCKRNEHDAIVVDGCCAVPDHPGVWAVGDCAAVPKPSGKGTYAPTAQNATREGSTVARNIVAAMQGKQPQPFVYKPIGELAIVGRRTGVASVYGVHLSGLLAWAMWRGIYLAKMPRMRNRVRVGLEWLLDLAFGREIAELPVARSSRAAGEAHG